MALRRYQHKFLQPLEIDQTKINDLAGHAIDADDLYSDVANFSSTTLKQVSETAVNQFNSVLNSIGGTLTIDVSQGTVFLGDLDFSVTTWAFVNVPTTNGRAVTVTAIIDGDTAQTYGDPCSVNGTSISGGVKWSGGTPPISTNNYDIIRFIIVTDAAGVINVFGIANTNIS